MYDIIYLSISLYGVKTVENEKKEISPKPEEMQYVYENRRYVGTKETVGFVLWDAAQSLNINIYATRFIRNIVKIARCALCASTRPRTASSTARRFEP